MSKDKLGVPFKELEAETQIILPAEKFLCIRIDGKNFSSWTNDFDKPFDRRISEAMVDAAKAVCHEVDKAQIAYIQSDECSIIVAPALEEHWFGGKVQKIVSVTASIFTAAFNDGWAFLDSPARFDSRVFTLDNMSEVVGYIQWRQIDNHRNFVNSVASYHFSHKQLMNVPQHERLNMLTEKNVVLNEQFSPRFHKGMFVYRDSYVTDVEWEDSEGQRHIQKDVTRSYWNAIPSPRVEAPEDLDPYVKIKRTRTDV